MVEQTMTLGAILSFMVLVAFGQAYDYDTYDDLIVNPPSPCPNYYNAETGVLNLPFVHEPNMKLEINGSFYPGKRLEIDELKMLKLKSYPLSKLKEYPLSFQIVFPPIKGKPHITNIALNGIDICQQRPFPDMQSPVRVYLSEVTMVVKNSQLYTKKKRSTLNDDNTSEKNSYEDLYDLYGFFEKIYSDDLFRSFLKDKINSASEVLDRNNNNIDGRSFVKNKLDNTDDHPIKFNNEFNASSSLRKEFNDKEDSTELKYRSFIGDKITNVKDNIIKPLIKLISTKVNNFIENILQKIGLLRIFNRIKTSLSELAHGLRTIEIRANPFSFSMNKKCMIGTCPNGTLEPPIEKLEDDDATLPTDQETETLEGRKSTKEITSKGFFGTLTDFYTDSKNQIKNTTLSAVNSILNNVVSKALSNETVQVQDLFQNPMDTLTDNIVSKIAYNFKDISKGVVDELAIKPFVQFVVNSNDEMWKPFVRFKMQLEPLNILLNGRCLSGNCKLLALEESSQLNPDLENLLQDEAGQELLSSLVNKVISVFDETKLSDDVDHENPASDLTTDTNKTLSDSALSNTEKPTGSLVSWVGDLANDNVKLVKDIKNSAIDKIKNTVDLIGIGSIFDKTFGKRTKRQAILKEQLKKQEVAHFFIEEIIKNIISWIIKHVMLPSEKLEEEQNDYLQLKNFENFIKNELKKSLDEIKSEINFFNNKIFNDINFFNFLGLNKIIGYINKFNFAKLHSFFKIFSKKFISELISHNLHDYLDQNSTDSNGKNPLKNQYQKIVNDYESIESEETEIINYPNINYASNTLPHTSRKRRDLNQKEEEPLANEAEGRRQNGNDSSAPEFRSEVVQLNDANDEFKGRSVSFQEDVDNVPDHLSNNEEIKEGEDQYFSFVNTALSDFWKFLEKIFKRTFKNVNEFNRMHGKIDENGRSRYDSADIFGYKGVRTIPRKNRHDQWNRNKLFRALKRKGYNKAKRDIYHLKSLYPESSEEKTDYRYKYEDLRNENLDNNVFPFPKNLWDVFHGIYNNADSGESEYSDEDISYWESSDLQNNDYLSKIFGHQNTKPCDCKHNIMSLLKKLFMKIAYDVIEKHENEAVYTTSEPLTYKSMQINGRQVFETNSGDEALGRKHATPKNSTEGKGVNMTASAA